MNEQEYDILVRRHDKNKRNLIISIIVCLSSYGLTHVLDFFSRLLSSKTEGEFTALDNATGGEIILSIVLVLLMLLLTIVCFISLIFIIKNIIVFFRSSSKISRYKHNT